MLQSNLQKQPTKADMTKKVEAWRTLNSVLVKANSEFMQKLHGLLEEKRALHKQLQEKLENQTGTEEDIKTNLLGTMYITEKYAFQKAIKSVLFNSSVSSLTGNEFSTYVASKAGVTGYMKNCAIRLANEYKATCNALCFGGVITELNKPVIENPQLWKKIMDVTPLKKWATAQEAAQWCYFMTVTNTFCTGQAIDISGGERNCADLFIWDK